MKDFLLPIRFWIVPGAVIYCLEHILAIQWGFCFV